MVTPENFSSFYNEFGGLYVYELERLEVVMWLLGQPEAMEKGRIVLRTFNEKYAFSELDRLTALGQQVRLNKFLVQFDKLECAQE